MDALAANGKRVLALVVDNAVTLLAVPALATIGVGGAVFCGQIEFPAGTRAPTP
jgi:hypothetical protein